MPHDKSGKPIKVGDSVWVTGSVKSLDGTSETGCNVTVEICNAPNEAYHPVIVMNCKGLEVTGAATAAKPTDPPATIPNPPDVPPVSVAVVSADSGLFPYPMNVPPEIMDIAINAVTSRNVVTPRVIHAVLHVMAYAAGRWFSDPVVTGVPHEHAQAAEACCGEPKEALASFRNECELPRLHAAGQASVPPFVLAALKLFLQLLQSQL